MKLGKIQNKTRLGVNVLRNEGFTSFTIKVLQKIQSSKGNSQHALSPIYTRVRTSDALAADLNTPSDSWKGTKRKSLRFNWLMPPPGRGSGGHINIFRFIKFLEEAGHECRIYLYTQVGTSPINDIRSVMDSYPLVKAKMEWLGEDNKMEPADGVFATSWETAYASYNSPMCAKRFYFVQDFEPYFYAPGSLYALAENSYKFRFYGVTAGNWLATKLKRDYGMNTDYFDFGSDSSHYSFRNKKRRKEILFYARPYTERRGFEMGVMALELFHEKHPEYTINFVGFDVSNYLIPFPYKNLKTLEVSELNDLYNRCAAGLVLSFTNMSLLPLELLGSGVIPVVNDGKNNRMVSNNKFLAYSHGDPVSLANTLSDVVTKEDLPEYADKASRSVKTNDWRDSGSKFIQIIERETRKSE